VTGTLVEQPIDPRCNPDLLAVRTMRAIGTRAVIAVTRPERADEALTRLGTELRAIDEACSRFRDDSELRTVERTGAGRAVRISPLLFEALEVACAVAVLTAGIVDPTIGSALAALGYDRDFDQIRSLRPLPEFEARPAPGWWQIVLDPDRRTVALPAGIHVDLGCTAKALVSDRAARRIAADLGCGVLVSLGGDVAVSGPAPRGGWPVGIAAHCTTAVDQVDQVVAVFHGGLASSGTTARTWARDGHTVHHIIDPWTGKSAPRVWSLVSTTGPTCVEANAWSTAAVVWGDDAPGNLAAQGINARLVRHDGTVVHVGDWSAATPPVPGPATGTPVQHSSRAI
jgi:thiamine biosynthesis lipoprotein